MSSVPILFPRTSVGGFTAVFSGQHHDQADYTAFATFQDVDWSKVGVLYQISWHAPFVLSIQNQVRVPAREEKELTRDVARWHIQFPMGLPIHQAMVGLNQYQFISLEDTDLGEYPRTTQRLVLYHTPPGALNTPNATNTFNVLTEDYNFIRHDHGSVGYRLGHTLTNPLVMASFKKTP
jgi:hypothetical protein